MKYKIREGEEVKVCKKIPKGWKIEEGTLTQPVGTVWIKNGEPLFVKGKDGKMHKNPKRGSALLVTNEELMITRIAEKRRYCPKEANDFITDKKTEERIRAEVNRQNRAHRAWEREREALIEKNRKRREREKQVAQKKKIATKKPTGKKTPKKK